MNRLAMTLVLTISLACMNGSLLAAELRGVVYRADGTLAKGATVSIAAVFVSPPVRIQIETDESGKFVTPLPAHERWVVCARLDREGGEANNAHGSVTVPKRGDPPPVVIRMVERGALRGRVLQSEDDVPVAGAKLYLSSGDVLTTDEMGRYSIGGLPLAGEHSLIPVAPGRTRRYIIFDTTLRPEAELDIHLDKAGKFAGSVLDEDGKPIPGAYLTRSSSGNALTLNGWDEVCEADGRFVYDGVPTERLFYNLQAHGPDYESGEHQFPTIRLDQPAPEFTFRLKRKSGPKPAIVASPKTETAVPAVPRRNLSGTVLDPDDKPVADVLVRWGATMYEETRRETRTDQAGHFTLDDVPDRDGFVTAIGDKRFAPRFEPVAKGETDVPFGLEYGRVARGKVTTRSGKPLAGVAIIPVMRSPDQSLLNPLWISERQTESDKDGRFELQGLPQNDVQGDFLKNGFSELRNERLQFGDKENHLTLVGIGAIRGQVLDPVGKPVRNFRLRLQIPRNLVAGQQAGGYYAGFDWYGASFTSEDGTFVLSGVPAQGWLRVHAIAPGFGQAIMDPVQALSIDELDSFDPIKFQLTPPHAVRINVTDEETGHGIPDAAIALLDDNPALDKSFQWGYHDLWALRGRTDQNGIADMKNLVFGEATIIVTSPGRARHRLRWRDGQEALEIKLAKESVLSGIVKVGERPLKAYYISLKSEANDYIGSSVEAKHDGRFRIDQLPAGQYEVTIRSDQQQLHHETISIEAGKSQELDIQVKVIK